MYTVAFKSGTGGYSDEDNCDCVVAQVPSNNIPQAGAYIHLSIPVDGKYENHMFLVREVKYSINMPGKITPPAGPMDIDFGEWIYVYVIPA